jgi:chromatin segregation and condensation protein Rec8/ScpA/Scc1 (kleisin family)
MDMALYQVADIYLQDLNRLKELDLDEQTFADTLESLSGDLEIKATNVAMFMRNLEANAEAIKAAEQQMAERRKALEKRAERIRQYLLDNMERCGIKSIECPFFKLTVRANPESLILEQDAVIPPEFIYTPEPPPPQVDKTRLKAAIKAGLAVQGARLDRKNRLEIK